MSPFFSHSKADTVALVNLEIKAKLYQKHHEDDKKNKHVVRALNYVKYCDHARGWSDFSLGKDGKWEVMHVHFYAFSGDGAYWCGIKNGGTLYHVTGKTAKEAYARALRFFRMLTSETSLFGEHRTTFIMRLSAPNSFQVSEMRRAS